MVAPKMLSLMVGVALCVVLVYALVRMWLQDKSRRDEAEFVERMEEQLRQIHFIESGSRGDDPPERPIGA